MQISPGWGPSLVIYSSESEKNVRAVLPWGRRLIMGVLRNLWLRKRSIKRLRQQIAPTSYFHLVSLTTSVLKIPHLQDEVSFWVSCHFRDPGQLSCIWTWWWEWAGEWSLSVVWITQFSLYSLSDPHTSHCVFIMNPTQPLADDTISKFSW